MKKLILAAIILSTSSAFALEVKCEASVGPRLGRTVQKIKVEYKNGYAYVFKVIDGYTFNGSCGEETCDISINNSETLSGFVSTNGAFSKLNKNRISISYFANDDMVAEVECVKVK